MEHKHNTCDGWAWLRTEIIFDYNKKTGKKDKDSGRRLEIFYCPVHEVETCRCGIEWGFHTQTYKELEKCQEL